MMYGLYLYIMYIKYTLYRVIIGSKAIKKQSDVLPLYFSYKNTDMNNIYIY